MNRQYVFRLDDAGVGGVRTATRLQGEGAKGQHIGRQAGLQEGGLVGGESHCDGVGVKKGV